MKPFIQRLPLPENSSFIARTFRTPYLEVGWHQHEAYELILFTKGSGLAFIGKHVGKFEPGDIYFLGSNLPHSFQKSNDEAASAIVIHFSADFWGKEFVNMPECRKIKELLAISGYGLMLTGNCKVKLQSLIKSLEIASGIGRIILFLQCLQVMTSSKGFVTITTSNAEVNYKSTECIDKVFQFTLENFQNPVTLQQVASIACMSIPSFCHYFKRRTQKKYFDFLNEVRVSYACHQLLETDKPISDICYDSGYNTVAHFHRQFLKLKKITPLQYRKAVIPINNRYQILNLESQ